MCHSAIHLCMWRVCFLKVSVDAFAWLLVSRLMHEASVASFASNFSSHSNIVLLKVLIVLVGLLKVTLVMS